MWEVCNARKNWSVTFTISTNIYFSHSFQHLSSTFSKFFSSFLKISTQRITQQIWSWIPFNQGSHRQNLKLCAQKLPPTRRLSLACSSEAIFFSRGKWWRKSMGNQIPKNRKSLVIFFGEFPWWFEWFKHFGEVWIALLPILDIVTRGKQLDLSDSKESCESMI